jgi:hypothetical protein
LDRLGGIRHQLFSYCGCGRCVRRQYARLQLRGLINPWADISTLRNPTLVNLADYFSTAASGFINLLFLVWLFKQKKLLRTAVLAMMPFCWVVFYLESLRPREGYFVWTLSILLVLFSERSSSKSLVTTN